MLGQRARATAFERGAWAQALGGLLPPVRRDFLPPVRRDFLPRLSRLSCLSLRLHLSRRFGLSLLPWRSLLAERALLLWQAPLG